MYLPSRLSLFLLLKGSGLPIPNIPFYAEVVSPKAILESTVEIDHRLDDHIVRQLRELDPGVMTEAKAIDRVLKAVQEAISRLLSSDARDKLTNEHDLADKFIYEIIWSMKAANGGELKNTSDSDLRQSAEKTVRQKAGDFGLELKELDPPPETTKTAYPLGILATDHAGYLSFDLKRLPKEIYISLVDAIDQRRKDAQASINTSVWFYAFAREDMRFDALVQGRFAEDAILTKLELPTSLPLPFDVKNVGYLSLQDPSLTDWRLSPSSFASNPALLIGDDEDCENLLPAHLALQEYRFYQVVGLSNMDHVGRDGLVRLGVVHEYRVAWYPLGHSLGEILYSLPLAPGESINLAVIDWTRRDDAARKENTTLDEQIVHQEHRDRMISETVTAAVKEYQHGSSFMGGIAGSGGYNSGAYAVGIAGSLGGSTASSSGTRDIAANTVQKISDNISQVSSAARELQSTVVVQTNQSEKEAIETRTVVNYNHSHALTILYYEVLRHYRIVTEFVRRRPAVMIKLKTDWFDGPDAKKLVRENRAALESHLLVPSLAGAFDALERIEHRRQLAIVLSKEAPVQVVPPTSFRYFVFDMMTGGLFSDEKGENVSINAVLWPVNHKLNDGNPFSPPGAFTQANANNSFVGRTSNGEFVKWDDIELIAIGVDIFKGDESNTDVSFQHIKVTGIDAFGNEVILVDKGYEAGHLILTNDATVELPTKRPVPPPPLNGRPAEEIEDDVKSAQLIEHLKSHEEYYSRAIFWGQDPADRAIYLAGVQLPDGTAAADIIDNRPLDIIGDYVAYSCTDREWSDIIDRSVFEVQMDDLYDERLVTLPARGVFAEAKLGHCNASEEIDNTRFWDWQQSPIPHLAPEISPIKAVTPQPQTQNLTPTAFPQSLVNIVNPPSVPDPTGLSSAMNVLATSNLFRDMSGINQVTDLLKKLSDNSVAIANSPVDKSKSTSGSSSSSGSSGGSSGGTTSGSGSGGSGGSSGSGTKSANQPGGMSSIPATPVEPSRTTRNLQDLQQVLLSNQKKGLITPEDAQAIYKDSLANELGLEQVKATVPDAGARSGYNDPQWQTDNARMQDLLSPWITAAQKSQTESLPMMPYIEMLTEGTSRFNNGALGINPSTLKPMFLNAAEIVFRLKTSQAGKWKDFHVRQITTEMAQEISYDPITRLNKYRLAKFKNQIEMNDDPDPKLQSAISGEVAFYDSPGIPYNGKGDQLDLSDGDSSAPFAGTTLLFKQYFFCWVEARSINGGDLQRISPIFPWHSRQFVAFDDEANKWVPYPWPVPGLGEGALQGAYVSHIGPGLDLDVTL
ncbi:hypothetical protein [Gorillibacterium massiliense]|uniref:hypothetical protein n=1 Tax=Gorillibacterium massiliense TaxID=1280390 RepID=UPI0004BCC969|nr:hypothetical protein [Gorillibacterium massiliense]